MSLDCYPFGARRTIDLREQPIALDVAYDENLLITVVDNCHTIIVFDLEHTEDNNVIGRFQLGEDIVIDKVVYSKTGDYIVSVGHNNGRVGLYAALNWRGANTTDQTAPTKLTVEELNLRDLAEPFDEIDRNDKLNSIDVCQRTGNLAANYGDLVVIYQLDPKEQQQHEERLEQQGDQNQLAQQASPTWSATEDLSDEFDRLTLARRSNFKHLVSVKLAIWASRVVLCENYLSIMAMDHVQVLKLEVLTLQIQSDGLDEDGSPGQQQVNRSAGSSGESHHQTMAGRQRNGPGGAPNAANDTTVSDTVSASGDESSGSMVSGMTSNQSTRTNFSSFLATDNEEMLAAGSGATSAASASASASSSVAAAATPSALGSNQGATRGDELVDYDQMEQQQLNNATATDSDMSIITMNNSNVAELEKKVQQQQQQHQQQQSQLQMEQAAINSQDDCITWNLNTKKLVKLPTLMHNTSTDLSSFHICHPLELLGPASESIACRVSARIYSVDLSQNQLEPVVLLCKQFDFDRDPVKLVQLEAVYLGATLDEQKRLNRAQHGQASGGGGSVSGSGPDGITSVIAAPTTHTGAPVHDTNELGGLVETPNGLPATGIGGCRPVLLKSTEHELLASVCCFVSTLTNCFIYSLAAKKVTRLQTITHPGLCLDLRADLLNVYLLTPLGLQVCSTSICDATFRHDWSSAADLNLSFIACNRARVLATRKHLVMVSSSSQLSDWDLEPICQQPTKDEFRQKNEESCRMASFVEVLQKPGLDQLQKRIVQTVQCCQSISIRSNLLTYLQTLAQLEVIDLEHKLRQQLLGGQQLGGAAKLANGNNSQLAEARSNLKMVSLMLARQLLHKKQTNAITNSRIDKTIKHLLDNSFCDLGELMQRHLDDTPSDRTTTTSLNVTASPPLEARRRGASSACELDDELDPDKTFAGEEDEEEEEQDDDDDEQPADGNFELLKIYLRHTKFNPPILNYLKSLIQYDGQETKQSPAFNQVISYMFDYNPRLLIKCAQRITRELPAQWLSSGGCLEYLVEQLKQLVKLNSTGINRATVLFTLAILYHEMAAAAGDGQSSSSPVESSDREASGEPQNDVQLAQMRNKQQLQEQCLSALSQIKPLNHLAITMCSNHEIIGKSMAKLVNEHYPQVFKLFLNQLQKRDELLAASEFERLVLSPANQRCPLENGQQQADRRRSSLDEHGVSLAGRQQEDQDQDQEEEEEEIGGGDDEELFEQKLRLLAEISPVELAEFFCRELEAADQQQQAATNDDCNTKHCSSSLKSSKLDGDTMQAYLRASINLMESKFILARLCENSSR